MQGENYLLKATHTNYKPFAASITPISDTTIDIELQPEHIKLNDVLVISGKYDRNINLSPFSFSVIHSNEIQKNPAQTIPDLLKTESGISLLQEGIRRTKIIRQGLKRINIRICSNFCCSSFEATLICGKIFNDKDLLKRSIATILILVGAILILRE